MNKMNEKFYGVLAAGSATVFTSKSASAATIGDIVESLTDSFRPVATLISVICYLGGAALVAQGLMKLKNHIDAPEKAPLKDALGRLIVGAGLIAIPFIVDAVLESMGGQTGSNVGYTDSFDAN